MIVPAAVWLSQLPDVNFAQLLTAAAMLAARILRTAGKIANKVAPARAVTMHAVADGVPPVRPQQQQQQQLFQQQGQPSHQHANGLAASVAAMG